MSLSSAVLSGVMREWSGINNTIAFVQAET